MLRKLISLSFFFIALFISYPASAMLSLELTRGVAGAIPIAIAPFALQDNSSTTDVSDIITNDLQNSGRFKVYGRHALTVVPSSLAEVQSNYFHRLGADDLVIGKMKAVGAGRFQVSFQLIDIVNGQQTLSSQNVILNRSYTVSSDELRTLAHHISDLIYQQLTGIRGIFSTKLAYVVVQRPDNAPAQYTLEVSDQDGYNPQPLLTSPDPIMSPAWSPNGKQLAYVSFENQRASIYIQNVENGSRYLLSQFPGINGAPAWSPNGKKIAVVLSKSGSPNIYVMDIGSHKLTQYTNDWYINTEPAWSPDSRFLLFTSNRSGGPQIYQITLASGNVSRVSYEGDYNARPSFTSDGSRISFIHRESEAYQIAIQDLDTSALRILTNAGKDNDSPSMAPNGSMILYDTIYNGRSVLAMVSTDGRVQIRLPARNGEAQDPAWSPYIS